MFGKLLQRQCLFGRVICHPRLIIFRDFVIERKTMIIDNW